MRVEGRGMDIDSMGPEWIPWARREVPLGRPPKKLRKDPIAPGMAKVVELPANPTHEELRYFDLAVKYEQLELAAERILRSEFAGDKPARMLLAEIDVELCAIHDERSMLRGRIERAKGQSLL